MQQLHSLNSVVALMYVLNILCFDKISPQVSLIMYCTPNTLYTCDNIVLQVKPYNIRVTLSFPPDTDTPGLQDELDSGLVSMSV